MMMLKKVRTSQYSSKGLENFLQVYFRLRYFLSSFGASALAEWISFPGADIRPTVLPPRGNATPEAF